MAALRLVGTRIEIRECHDTARGPRQRLLTSFRGVLSPEVLDVAEAKATRPFSREQVCERARALGIPVSDARRDPEARALLGILQRGGSLDARLVTLLQNALASLPKAPLPEHLEEAADWVGQTASERGQVLRELLRAGDRALRSRRPLREREGPGFPRFDSSLATGS